MKVFVLNAPAVNNVRIVREGRCMQRQDAWGTSWAPLTLALIASILRQADFSVKLKDCPSEGVNLDSLEKEIKEFKPNILVVNTSTPSIDSDMPMAGWVKDIDPKIKTIFFGIHVSALPKETLEAYLQAEFIAVGEPEHTILDFALAVREDKPLNTVPGLVYKNNNQIYFNTPRGFINNLDDFPYPAWDLVDLKRYRLPITRSPFLLVLIGRGCPYSCNFCAAGTFYGKTPRLRSPERIVSEMKYVRNNYGVSDFLFWSENSMVDKKQLFTISGLLAKENPKMRWVCNGRVDLVDEALLLAMKKGGCWMIGYGVESGSQRVLDLMGKKIRIEDIERTVNFTKKSGIQTTAHVILGYPGETKDDLRATARLVRRVNFDYIQTYCCVPFPGSELYLAAKEKGWIIPAKWKYYEQNYSVISTPFLLPQDVMQSRQSLLSHFICVLVGYYVPLCR